MKLSSGGSSAAAARCRDGWMDGRGAGSRGEWMDGEEGKGAGGRGAAKVMACMALDNGPMNTTAHEHGREGEDCWGGCVRVCGRAGQGSTGSRGRGGHPPGRGRPAAQPRSGSCPCRWGRDRKPRRKRREYKSCSRNEAGTAQAAAGGCRALNEPHALHVDARPPPHPVHPQTPQSHPQIPQPHLKMPLMLHSTSMRGRPPSSSKGISSNRAMRPVPSRTGRAPTRYSAIATDSPCDVGRRADMACWAEGVRQGVRQGVVGAHCFQTKVPPAHPQCTDWVKPTPVCPLSYLGLDRVQPPQVHRHRLGPRPLVGLPVRHQHRRCGCCPALQGSQGWHAVGVQGVDVAAGGQDACAAAGAATAAGRMQGLARCWTLNPKP